MRLLPSFIVLSAVTACALFDVAERQALRNGAVADARRQPAEIHWAYLQCYALKTHNKGDCKRQIGNTIDSRRNAQAPEYTLTFDHEAERLGFAAFLQNEGLSCGGVAHGPLFDVKHNAYRVICRDGSQYNMRFDYQQRQWSRVVEGE